MPDEAERLVEAQLAAFNRHDAVAFAQVYAVDAEVTSVMNGMPPVIGREAIATYFAELFNTFPNMHATIHHRSRIGPLVIDHEHVAGLDADALAVYEVQDGHIARAWLFGPLPV